MRVGVDGKSQAAHGVLHLVRGLNPSKIELIADALTPRCLLAFAISDQKAIQHSLKAWNHLPVGVVMAGDVVSVPCDTPTSAHVSKFAQ